MTRAGRDACDVIVFPPESRIGIPKSGVLYVNDPRAKTMVAPESGFWDFTDESKVLRALDYLHLHKWADKQADGVQKTHELTNAQVEKIPKLEMPEK